MTTDPAPSATTPEDSNNIRGYYNKSNLEDLALAESVFTATNSYPDELTEQDITPAYLTGFSAVIAETRRRASESGQGGEESKTATTALETTAVKLHTRLQKIQSSAKQKHKMLAEDGDPTTNFPTTNFPTDGYLIGVRMIASRAILLQSADTLIARIKADDLPGFKTTEKIKAVEDLLTAYKNDKSEQTETIKEKELARLDRDSLLHILNTRRAAIQHAADAIWPWNEEAHRPIRKTFALPLTRPMGM